MSNATQPLNLDVPVKRGESEIRDFTLHKPNSGALRGISIRKLLDMESDHIIPLLPRIADPKMTPQEAAALEPQDLLQAGVAIASFFLPSAALEEAKKEAESLTT